MSALFSQPNKLNSSTQLTNKTEEQQFLRFNLYPNTKAMLPIGQITEVLKIQFSQIVPIPQMPSWVMGVYNWRGDILWTIDLGHLIGLNPWYQREINHSNHTAIVLSPNKEKRTNNGAAKINLGLVVSKVEDIEMFDLVDIQVPPKSTINSQIATFLQGYWLRPEGDTISILNGQEIIAAMPNNLTN